MVYRCSFCLTHYCLFEQCKCLCHDEERHYQKLRIDEKMKEYREKFIKIIDENDEYVD